MKLRRLLNSFHGFDLGQHLAQQSAFVEQKKGLACMALDQHPGELIANALLRYLINLRGRLLNRLKSSRLDGVSETRGEADSTQHPELVFGEPSVRIADGSDDSGFEILASANEIQNLVRDRIEQQAVDGEIAAFDIFSRILAETNLVGMTSVAVSDVAAKGGDFNH